MLFTSYEKLLILRFLYSKKSDGFISIFSWFSIIGITIGVGAIIEASHDDKGIIWPLNIAPFKASIINLMIDDENCKKVADNFYNQLSNKFEILYDDRDCSIGKKLSDNDLIGIPYQIIIGKRDVKDNLVEFKIRQTNESKKISIDEAINIVSQKINL